MVSQHVPYLYKLSRLHNTLLNLSFIKKRCKLCLFNFSRYWSLVIPFTQEFLNFQKSIHKTPQHGWTLNPCPLFLLWNIFFSKMTNWLKGWLKCSCANVHTSSDGRCFVTKRKGKKLWITLCVSEKTTNSSLINFNLFWMIYIANLKININDYSLFSKISNEN